MRADPVNKTLRKGRFRIGVVGCAERGDEQLADAHLAGRPVHHLQRRAGVIHEHPLAGDMRLPHGRRQAPLPGAVKFAVPASYVVHNIVPLCCAGIYVARAGLLRRVAMIRILDAT